MSALQGAGKRGGACRWCGRDVGPLTKSSHDDKLWTRGHAISVADPDGLFCKMRCAMLFGVRAARKEAA